MFAFLSFFFLFCLEISKKNLNLIFNFEFFWLENFKFSLSILMDKFSLLFAYCLLLIVFSVLSFSKLYMLKKTFFVRFKMLIVLFVFSMILLIFIPDLIFFLIGWDGLGLISFLLMMFYLSKNSFKAGMKTYFMNRLGDGFFIMGFGILVIQKNWLLMSLKKSMVLGILFSLGCFTKSAQFPFSSWLPDAMAAPTPVSALVHSSTLVTAGMFCLIRFFYCLKDTFFFLFGLMGFWTMMMASMTACFEFDSKKMMAYSTLSQLGLMLISLSLGLVKFAFFHLLTHAVFKALLFICSGYKMLKKKSFSS